MKETDWVKLIGGGFAYMKAPFAVHPHDKLRAKKYLLIAQTAGLSVEDTVLHAKLHLEKASGWPTNIDDQLKRVRKFFEGKLAS